MLLLYLKLRYYATFKVRKFESLFYKINTCLLKTTTCTGYQGQDIFSVKISIYILNFERGFCDSFSILFPEALAFCGEKVLKQFLLHCISICISSKNLSRIFKILFQTGNINIFVLRGVFFSRSVQLRSFISGEKKQR